MRSKVSMLAVVAVLATAPAWAQSSVQTYTNKAVPPGQQGPASYGTPLSAGQMTLEDVLETHPQPPKAALTAPNLTANPVPVLTAPTTQSSTESSMLMQGMRSVLQDTKSSAPLEAPQLPGAVAAAAATASSPLVPPTASVPTASAPSGIAYQPGRGPRDLATGSPLSVTPNPSPDATAFVDQAQDNPTLEPTATTGSSSSAPAVEAATASTTAPTGKPGGPCVAHTETWSKSCAEAGYPQSFVGSIEGETHVTCPAGSLQDVWVANSCAPADGAGPVSAALSAPEPLQSTQPIVGAPGTGNPAADAAYIAASNMAGGGIPGIAADGSCGPINGSTVSIKPAEDLCAAGRPSDVAGEGPWRWSCNGIGGGMTVSCAVAAENVPVVPVAAAETASATPANAAAEDGVCGAANEAGTDYAPNAGLCASGIASRVSGDGPWNWACSGRNGGQAAACTAARKTDGVCGGANGGAGADNMPMTDLCKAGYASAVTGEGPWSWTCSGIYGGAAALCSASPKQDAICGSASLYGHREAPRDHLCSVGQSSNVNGGGPWTWTCQGGSGGAAVTCTSPISVNGGCGAANGVMTPATPSDNLCTYGKPSRVTGAGPFNWTCAGTDGGESQSCTAPFGQPPVAAVMSSSTSAGAGTATAVASATPAAPVDTGNGFVTCGAAADFAAFAAPSKDLCAKGNASTVSGDGPWHWTCADNQNHSTECATLSESSNFGGTQAAKPGEMPAPLAAPAASVASEEEKPTCGPANNQGTASEPTTGLCSIGSASHVTGDGPYMWTCEKNKGKAECRAPKILDASCGAANGALRRVVPTNELCNAGMATTVQGAGPWMWSCVGTGGGVSVSCSSGAQTQSRVDGNCGNAAVAVATSTPTTELCDGGLPSNVYGQGPWTWTCSGLNGGTPALCAAQKTSGQAPPPPGPSVNGLCGNANGMAAISQPEDSLCVSGTSTALSGNGPWNWNCLGANGGMTVSCTAPLQPPSPITGVCGSATGVSTLVAPRGGLCGAGISSAVSGRGPWTWSCSGTNGGGAVACVAPLAGGGGAGLPSLVTPSSGSSYSGGSPYSEAPAPMPAETMPVTSRGLQTPHLQDNSLPPLPPDEIPHMVPSSPFPTPPEPSAMPPVPPEEPMTAPLTTPTLPADTTTLTPPPVRDQIKSSSALTPDASARMAIPGSHVILPDNVASMSFMPNADSIDPKSVSSLDKLAMILQANAGTRVTLTSYAGVGPDTSPRDARRLSLTRALAVRDYLTAKGVASARINVRALGANVPSGDPDRIDVTAE